jgi:hypothetical protein
VPRGCLRACCRHRGRGDPIALDDGHPEAVHDQLMRLVADPFGPTNELQGRKIAGLGGTGVLVDEGVGGQEHAGLGLARQAGDYLGVQGRTIMERPNNRLDFA